MFCIAKHSIVWILFITCFLGHASADNLVQINVSDKVIANAAFYQGEADKPVVLILHGFMLTHHFPLVERLANSLHESGYTVLTPTLSLDINKRKKSLACEAIHTHSLTKDIAELDLWIQWLKEKTGKNIFLIGHSTSSIISANYLSQHTSGNVQHVIFISMPDLDAGIYKNQTVAQREKARQLISDNDNSLYNFELLYCKKYPTTAKNFLSYARLSKEKISSFLEEISINKTLIFGSNDKITNQEWNLTLSDKDVEVITIENADHFFDYEYEFDLFDSIDTILKKQTDKIKAPTHLLKK